MVTTCPNCGGELVARPRRTPEAVRSTPVDFLTDDVPSAVGLIVIAARDGAS